MEQNTILNDIKEVLNMAFVFAIFMVYFALALLAVKATVDVGAWIIEGIRTRIRAKKKVSEKEAAPV